MKTVGRTLDGKYLIEVEQQEYQGFLNLENSITRTGYFNDRFQGVDLSPVFKALDDLANAKHHITTLQSYINNLAAYFGKVDLPRSNDE